MKISILRPPIGIGGAEMSLTEMGVTLLRMGHSVWMHFDSGESSPFDSFNKFGKLKNRCSNDAKVFFHKNSFNENWAVENLGDTDVVIMIHRHLFSERLAKAVSAVKRKIVYCPGKNEHHVYGYTRNTPQFGKMIDVDDFIFNSEYTLNLHLSKGYPDVLKKKFKHIHPPMDLEHYSSYNLDDLNARGREFVDRNLFNVGIFGRLIPSKRPEAVLDIAAMAKNNSLGIRFNFIGGGKLQEQVSKDIVKRGLSNYVTLHGMQDEPFEYICSMDCILHLCEHESLSRALREAVFFEVPVVAYGGAGNLELLNSISPELLFQSKEEAYQKILSLHSKGNKGQIQRRSREKLYSIENKAAVDLEVFLK